MTCPREKTHLFPRCKFEPRYDYTPPRGDLEMSWGSVDAVRALGKETYVHDVCVRCGKTIDRPKA